MTLDEMQARVGAGVSATWNWLSSWYTDPAGTVETVLQKPNTAVGEHVEAQIGKVVSGVSGTLSPLLAPILFVGAAVLLFYYLRRRVTR